MGGGGERTEEGSDENGEEREGDKWGGEWRGREEDVRGEAEFRLGGGTLENSAQVCAS